jgi:hypothetical protein
MTLERKLELIHAVKCGKTDKPQIAEQSAREIARFKNRLEEAGLTSALETEIDNWKNSMPIALDREIEELANANPNN